jgi:hypothetical protein
LLGIAGLLCDQTQVVERGGLVGILRQDLTIDTGSEPELAPLVALKRSLDLAAELVAGRLVRVGHGTTRNW